MDDPTLDNLLKGCTGQPVPSLPSAFSRDVLREIRLRQSETSRGGNWIQEICALFFRPGLLAGSIAVVLAVGVALPMTMSKAMGADQAAASLGLNVFSSSSSNMPSGLLARVP